MSNYNAPIVRINTMQECDVDFMFFSPTAERNEVGEPSDILWYEDFIIVGGFSKDAVVQQTSITSSFSVFGEESEHVPQSTSSSSTSGIYLARDITHRRQKHRPATAMRPRNQSSRIVIAFWCLAMLVTTNLFTAKMKAALTMRDQTNQRVDSAAELAERNGMTVYMAAETAYPKLLSISPRDYDRKVYRMLKPTSLLTYRQLFSLPVLDEVAAGKAVLLIDRTTATYELASFCQHYPDNEFYISRDRFFMKSAGPYVAAAAKELLIARQAEKFPFHSMIQVPGRYGWWRAHVIQPSWSRDLGSCPPHLQEVRHGQRTTDRTDLSWTRTANPRMIRLQAHPHDGRCPRGKQPDYLDSRFGAHLRPLAADGLRVFNMDARKKRSLAAMSVVL
ncbi:hypothetical protein HPB51_005178 [Rhipicephalus microplus]|uniref:Uncharacterized protein n=1 Tax=Rhipicephalus microplus TaxID=6941 RepID=A0A9J6DKU4_RHIMP|nr:hypothetical protein HPB51_005178 [Rhipicephalus microplus]